MPTSTAGAARPPESESSPAAAVGLNFPSVASFPAPRDDPSDDETPRESRKPRRRQPAAELPSSETSAPAEPGDEGQEVGWMAGLSNRLSAYSLSEEDTVAADEPAAEPDTADESA